MDRKRWKETVFKYRYAAVVVLFGAALMLLPAGGKRNSQLDSGGRNPSTVQQEMEAILSGIDGVGRLKLMLTTSPGAAAARVDRSVFSDAPVPASDSSGAYTGALVVCEGADNASVRLELTQAVAALTGLPTDRVVIVRGSP